MATSDELSLLLQTKLDIKNAIESKGKTIGDIPFSQYASKILSLNVDMTDYRQKLINRIADAQYLLDNNPIAGQTAMGNAIMSAQSIADNINLVDAEYINARLQLESAMNTFVPGSV